ncbi:Os04g0472333 [Oryza sativa Japonica Group]|uniref:Os04g0472333 protein n=1 Tax=Oryza sativa subsp. japonica TaxID=39947 RepID=A0A0P0WBB5_ORYSJ|nr:hypothetical protein EE612_023893 [Oryza sativa]BAS89658.1 Os04g0472333 [Oryza sativa Japonica Group]
MSNPSSSATKAACSTLIIIPDKSLSFVKSRKSDNLMKFPAFLYLGFLSSLKELNGVEILAARMIFTMSSQVRLKVKTPSTLSISLITAV